MRLKQTDDEVQESVNSLAHLLMLLREYHERFGMPAQGGPKDQEYVLREVAKDLCSLFIVVMLFFSVWSGCFRRLF